MESTAETPEVHRFSTRTDYQPYMRLVRFLPWLGGALILTLIPLLLDQSQDSTMKLFLLLLLAFPLIFALTIGSHIVHQSHKQKVLLLSENAIEFQTYFYTLKTSLDNVSLLREDSGELWELELNEPGEITNTFLFGASPRESRYIPLIAFEDPQKQGPVLDALNVYLHFSSSESSSESA